MTNETHWTEKYICIDCNRPIDGTCTRSKFRSEVYLKEEGKSPLDLCRDFIPLKK